MSYQTWRRCLGYPPEFITSWSQVPVPIWDLLLAGEVGADLWDWVFNLWDNVRIELNCRTHSWRGSTGQDTVYLVSEASWEKTAYQPPKPAARGGEKSGKKQGREARGHSGRIHIVGQDSSYIQQAIFGLKISHLMDRCWWSLFLLSVKLLRGKLTFRRGFRRGQRLVKCQSWI